MVTPFPEALSPDPGERGLLQDLEELTRRVGRSWELAADVARRLPDPQAPGRTGRSALETLVGIARWDDSRWAAEAHADALEGSARRVDGDAEEDALRTAHADASLADVVAGLERAGKEAVELLGHASAADLALPTSTVLGPLPLATYLHASTYRVAVALLDVEPVLGGALPDEVVELGLVGLVDSVGGLAAREGGAVSLTAATDHGIWAFGARDGEWRLAGPLPGEPGGATVRAPARVLLDIGSGRAEDVGGLHKQGVLALDDVPALLRLAPLLDHVGHVQGAGALKLAARSMELANRAASAASAAFGKLRRPFG